MDNPKFKHSYIKNIYLPVFKYQFDHGPSDRENTNEFFTGRKEIKRRIQLLFEKSKSDHGAYLVTGYRGMGKTSVVREAFNEEFCKEGCQNKDCQIKECKVKFKERPDIDIKTFNFSLSQDEVRDIDLLRQIGSRVITYSKEILIFKKNWPFEITAWLLRFTSLLTCIYIPLIAFSDKFEFCFFCFDSTKEFLQHIPSLLGNEKGAGFYLFYFGVAAIIYSLLWSLSKKLIALLFKVSGKSKLKRKIDIFERRLYSKVTLEDKEKQGINLGQNNPVNYIVNKFFQAEILEPDSTKNIQSYELATTKEIEIYLFDILEEINSIRKKSNSPKRFWLLKNNKIPTFVFVIDELDKIEPDYIFSKGDRESDEHLHHSAEPYHIVTKARQRQEAISRLLANLKNFLSDAKAKFIFIGGRDMYDASLADIADRESFYSSIFNEVIYVNSFFKDKHTSNAGLSQMSELFIYNFLTPEKKKSKVVDPLKEYIKQIAFKLDNEKEIIKDKTNECNTRLTQMPGDRRDINIELNRSEKRLKSPMAPILYPDENSKKIRCLYGLKKLDEEEKNLKEKLSILEGQKEENQRNIETVQKSIEFKIIHLLQNFFIFLTYRSNGSPKKLIELVEKYLIGRAEVDKKINDEGGDGKKFRHLNEVIRLKNITDENGNNLSDQYEFYLRFSFNNQYEINLTSNYYRPYIIINSKHLKRLGDKLLYSTAFLMDHILKFNKSAFSWRNLEMLPDVILANKDPNFRQFFQEIMQFLSAQHLRETLNAVFQYIFYAKVRNEMAYLSKISELSSAAFNFTLDESFHLKSYYKKKLAAKYLEYHNHQGKDKWEYIHSIGYLHSIIGDLHYYDEEFDDAIIYYTDSVQAIRSILDDRKHPSSHKLLLYSRSQLSLGLSLERTRAYDKAYSIYRTLIIQTRNESFGKEDYSKSDDDIKTKWEPPYKRMHLFLKPHVALLGVIEKQRMDGITYDNLERNMYEYLSFLKMQGLALFPSDRNNNSLFYSKIREDNSLHEPKGFVFLGIENSKIPSKLISDRKRIATMIADYYVSVGSLLFFKNQVFFGLLYGRGSDKNEHITKAIQAFYSENNIQDQTDGKPASEEYDKSIAAKNEEKKSIIKKNYRPSHASYLYYLHALFAFNSPYIENYIELKKVGASNIKAEPLKPTEGEDIWEGAEDSLKPDLFNHLKFVLFYFEQSHYPILNGRQYEALANILAKLGDALLACVNVEPENFDIIDITRFEEYPTKTPEGCAKIVKKIDDISKRTIDISLDLPILIYRIAYDTYYKAGNFYSASFQFKKILFAIRNAVVSLSQQTEKDKADRIIEGLEEMGSVLMTNLVKITSASNRAQITKYRMKTTKNEDEMKKYTAIIYQNLSTAPEAKEIICLIELIKLKLDNKKSGLPITEIGPYNTISSMYSRIFELKLKSELILAELWGKKLIEVIGIKEDDTGRKIKITNPKENEVDKYEYELKIEDHLKKNQRQ